jgi:hypothetical protein
MNKLAAVALALLSTTAFANSDWIQIPSAGDGRAFLDRASFVETSGMTEVTVLRSYDELVTLGDDALTGDNLYPHRSAKVRYSVDCTAKKVGVGGWELYSGSLGDGKIVWADSESEFVVLTAPKSTEERLAFASVCSQDIATRKLVRRYAGL